MDSSAEENCSLFSDKNEIENDSVLTDKKVIQRFS